MMPRHQHPASRRDKLRRAGLSEASELRPDQIEALDALPADASDRKLREAAQKGRGSVKKKRERQPTIADRAVEMLRESGPMHYKDLAKKLVAAGVQTKGQTFAQTLSAALIRHPDAERVAPGVYKAKEKADG